MKILSIIAKALLFLTLLTPFIVSNSLYLFPFVFGKMLYIRSIVQLAALLGVTLGAVLLFREPERVTSRIRPFFSSKLVLALLGFFAAAAVSTSLAPDSFHAFWGDVERGEGYLGLLHYLALFALAWAIFGEREWRLFFGFLAGSAIIMAAVAWLQYFGVSLPFGLAPSAQPGSFTGNPAFLASYLILVLGGIAIIWQRTSRAFRTTLGLVAAFFLATVLITGIRGAVLGVAAGAFTWGALLTWRGTSREARRRGAMALAALILFGAVFFFTRGGAAWQYIPGLSRLAKTDLLATPSAATRLIGLKVSWEAFKERPVFGWGPENYNVAYNAHYDPAYAYYAEDWFDRAHNKIAEAAVMYGGAGLLLYLGTLALALWRARENPPLAGALVAYFVQNLFLFDNIVSYIPLFAILAYLAAREEPAAERPLGASTLRGLKVGSVLLTLLAAAWFAYYSYAHTYVPIRQALAYREAVRSRVGERILKASDEFLYPYNFLQSSLRAQFAELIYDNELLKSLAFRPLADKALTALEETAEREQEPRQYVRLVESYTELAKLDETLFPRIEGYARKALSFSPRRQGLMYHLAFTLAGEGRYEEAIAINREALALEPRAYKSHYQLGLILSLAADASKYSGTPQGEAYRREAREELERAWELAEQNDFLAFAKHDFRNFIVIYSRFKDHRAAAEVLEAMLACSEENVSRPCFRDDQQVYVDLMSMYRALRDAEGFVQTAERMKERFPALADQLDVLIDLGRKKNWVIIDSL